MKELAKLIQLIVETPDLKAAFTPLNLAHPALQQAPKIEQLNLQELGLWLLGFSTDLEDLFARWCPQASAKQVQLLQVIKIALARDPEPPIEWLERGIRHIAHWLNSGQFSFTGYYTLRRLHFLTRGYSSLCLRYLHQCLLPVEIAFIPELERVLADLEQNSYHLMPAVVAKEQISAIQDFARTTRCRPSLHDQEHRDAKTGQNLLPSVIFEPNQPLARRYDFDTQQMWRCQAIQELAAQSRWRDYATAFLKSPAKLVQAYMWWSVATNLPESRYTGQVFHVDLDRFHFVNFFFYLTPVDLTNGPQEYFPGSHQPPPLELAIDQRWSEEALAAVYGPAAKHTLTGPAGTVIMADTRAFHRGRPLESGQRLMLQFEFASSTLSDPAPVVTLPEQIVPELRSALEQMPERYPIFANP